MRKEPNRKVRTTELSRPLRMVVVVVVVVVWCGVVWCVCTQTLTALSVCADVWCVYAVDIRRLADARNDLLQTGQLLMTARSEIERDQIILTSTERDVLASQSARLVDVSAANIAQSKRLVNDLLSLYPIRVKDSKSCTIVGLSLVDDVSTIGAQIEVLKTGTTGYDQLITPAALGYVVFVLQYIAGYLSVILPYEMRFCGSHSYLFVRDQYGTGTNAAAVTSASPASTASTASTANQHSSHAGVVNDTPTASHHHPSPASAAAAAAATAASLTIGSSPANASHSPNAQSQRSPHHPPHPPHHHRGSFSAGGSSVSSGGGGHFGSSGGGGSGGFSGGSSGGSGGDSEIHKKYLSLSDNGLESFRIALYYLDLNIRHICLRHGVDAAQLKDHHLLPNMLTLVDSININYKEYVCVCVVMCVVMCVVVCGCVWL